MATLVSKHRHFTLASCMKCLLILFLHIVAISICQSQRSPYINFSVDNGLNSNEVYHILEDKEGLIWFATDKGVCKYNGYEFVKFTMNSGLADNTIFGFTEDQHGRLWLRSLNGQLSYIQNDSVHIVLPNNKFGNMRSLYVDQQDTIWFESDHKQYKAFLNGNGNYMYQMLPQYFVLKKIDHSVFGSITGSKSFHSSDLFYFNGNQYPVSIVNGKDENLSFSGLTVFNIDSNKTWVGTGKRILEFSNARMKLIKQFSKPKTSLFIMRSGDCFLGDQNGVFQLHSDGNLGKRFLENVNVTYMIEDHEGGYWFSPLEKGVFYSSNLVVQAFGLKTNHRISNFTESETKQLFAYNQHGDVYAEVEGKFEKVSLPEDTGKIKTKKKLKKSKVFDIQEKYELSILNKTLELKDKISKQIISIHNIHDRLRFSEIYRHNNTFYIPTTLGLYSYNVKTGLYFYGDDYPVLAERVNDVSIDRENRLWIASNDKGVFLLEKDSLIHINTYGYSMGGICRNIICGPYYTWVSTEEGLIRINRTNFGKMVKFTIKDGLLSNDISCLYLNNDESELVLGHPKGLSKFPVNFTPTSVSPRIQLSQVTANHKTMPPNKEYKLKHDSGLISITYQGISYNSDLRYKYRLRHGHDTTWTYTDDRNVQFVSLAPGVYFFEVYAINSSHVLSTAPASLKFIITPPFWSTWWFIGSSSLLGLALVFLFVKYRFRKLRAVVATERRLVDLEQQALRAQMNPHFIFNALNSVQLYILENDRRKANKYLSNFSKLVRSTLDNSAEKLILIEKELESIESYLALETLRFKDKINYEITLDDNLKNQGFKIPPLLLQPYVENAIWHGLMPKQKGGSVKINISDQQPHILCSIEDNGIGRKNALLLKRKKQKEHKSFGMNTTLNRIELMKAIYGKSFSVAIIDIENDDEALGTRIEITIPHLN
jgi:ligand-binding sensor domain-containing protein